MLLMRILLTFCLPLAAAQTVGTVSNFVLKLFFLLQSHHRWVMVLVAREQLPPSHESL